MNLLKQHNTNKHLLTFIFFLFGTQGCNDYTRGDIQDLNVEISNGQMTATATIQNTGSSQHTFPIGCSLLTIAGNWIDLPCKKVTLEPNETQTITFQKEIKHYSNLNKLDIAIWEKEKDDGTLDNKYAFKEYVFTHNRGPSVTESLDRVRTSHKL